MVRDLTDFFEKLSWKKSSFEDSKSLTAAERLSIDLPEARKLARFGPPEEAVKKLSAAHHSAWEVYGLREGIALPIGTLLNAKVIWTAALGQTKLNAALDARLKAARPYLFGDVEVSSFDPAKFEDAAKLLEELCSLPPAT